MLDSQLSEAGSMFEQTAFGTNENRKLALVIGIDEYVRQRQLQYCVNDANDVAEKLQDMNFVVHRGINCNRKKFDELINEFIECIQSKDVVFFYFAGHGNEFESKNYLVPADYNYDHSINEREYIEKNSINVQYILHRIQEKDPECTIMILDCCRTYIRNRATNSSTIGLAAMKGPPESLIAFSCGSNEVALDHTINQRNGVFTGCLLQYLAVHDQDIATILEMTGKDLKTHGFPLPWRSTCLTKKIYLAEQSMQIKKY